MEAALLEAKWGHPTWGSRQIRPYLTQRRHPGARPLQAEVQTTVWTADFKGQCRPGDGFFGSPLTVADAYSRLLLTCAARLSAMQVDARPSFKRLLGENGLPETMRPENSPRLPPTRSAD